MADETISASINAHSPKIHSANRKKASGSWLGKYRGIIISVALFLLLDASVMVVNFYVSYQIAEDAIGVNLAGRQRMLSQRIAKTLYALSSEDPTAADYAASLAELKTATRLFSETLTAFTLGGPAHSAGQNSVALTKVKSTDGQQLLAQASQIWQPYKISVENVLTDAPASLSFAVNLQAALNQAKAHNLELLGLMNDLTLNLEQVATSKAFRLRTIQTIGITLAIINFLFIMLHFMRQLRASDKILEKARNETTEILQTVNEGLFLVDKHTIISEQHSAKLAAILGTTDIAGRSLQALLEGMISEKDANTTRGFIELLFDNKIKEKLIGNLNPLNRIEVNIAQSNGGFRTKYLQFNFARAYPPSPSRGAKQISHVLVSVADVTEKIRLEKALTESRQQNNTQLEMLTDLLHTHPSLLQEFIHNSYACYKRINTILQKPDKDPQRVHLKATEIFREIHNFKGEAAALNLACFEAKAHSVEDTLSELRHKDDLTGNDYLGLTVQLNTLIHYTQQVDELTKKLALFGHNNASSAQPSSIRNEDAEKAMAAGRPPNDWSHFHEFIKNIAQRNGKWVKLVSSGTSEINLPQEYQQKISEICIQLLRNAVSHGIETPTDRELSEKPLIGRIDLRIAKLSDHEMEITVMDDGAGLDYNAIRNKAIASGRWDQAEIESWGNQQLLSLIFHDGFTTTDVVTKDAGRGVGMEMVLKRVREHRGKITVSSRRGRYCRWVIVLPIIAEKITAGQIKITDNETALC